MSQDSDAVVSSASLSVYHQDTAASDDPDVVIDGRDLASVEFDARVDEWLDEASITAHHPGLTTTGDLGYDLRVGDRIEFAASLIGGSSAYGETYGEGYGGGGDISWTGRVQPTETSRSQQGRGNASIAASAGDYVGDILANRKISKTWINADVGAVIRDVIELKASELDASNVPDLGVSTDVFFNGRDCWDAVISLASRADCIVYGNGVELHVDPIGGLTPAFTLDRTDYVLPWKTHTTDDVKNVVRVDSGVARQQEDGQETQDSWQRVTSSSRLTHQLRARKASIHSVELYVDGVADNEQLRVRLQADEGGSPVAIGDEDSDIDSAEWSGDELPDGGWQSLFFGNHTLADRDPWLIIETDGDTGHDVGVDANGVPTYRSFYPHPVNFEVSSPESIEQYGEREIRVEKQNLATLTAARDAANAELARRAYPTKTIEFEAASYRTHTLEPGDVITVDEPDQAVSGDYIVTEVSQAYDSGTIQLETNITATWRQGVLADL